MIRHHKQCQGNDSSTRSLPHRRHGPICLLYRHCGHLRRSELHHRIVRAISVTQQCGHLRRSELHGSIVRAISVTQHCRHLRRSELHGIKLRDSSVPLLTTVCLAPLLLLQVLCPQLLRSRPARSRNMNPIPMTRLGSRYRMVTQLATSTCCRE